MEKIEAISAIKVKVLEVVTALTNDTGNLIDGLGELLEPYSADALADWVDANATESELADINRDFGGVDEFVSSNMLSRVETTLANISEKRDDISEKLIDRFGLLSDESLEELSSDYDDNVDDFVKYSVDGISVSTAVMDLVRTGGITIGVNATSPLRDYMD